jgi:DNA-binding PucR family transcriptional regulator
MLLWSVTQPPPADIGVRIQRQMRMVLREIVRAVPELLCYCGIGTVRAGESGLAASATEARLAVASARSRRGSNAPVSFDAIGMRATLVEWYGSLAVQHAIDSLFAPLSDLTEAGRNAVIDTVGVYLDTMGSISQTAELMHMHRNSIKYRISKAFELLGIDPDDADQRLFLHLACRVARAQREHDHQPDAPLVR